MDDHQSQSQNGGDGGVGGGGGVVVVGGGAGASASGIGCRSMVDQQQQQQQQQLNSLVQGNSSSSEDNQSAGGGGGGVGGGSGGNAMSNMQQPYSIPGILHFIQHEWVRFEHERSQWDVDRAELQARISILLGERKSQESLKCDLIRRIKMLEYALKQERAKFHRLKYGCDPPNMTADDLRPPQGSEGVVDPLLVVDKTDQSIAGGGVVGVAADGQAPFTSVSNMTWRQGRQLLQQYLVEIGYTDNILDVRSNRVRSLLGLNNNNSSLNNNNNNNLDDEDMLNGGLDSANNKKNAERVAGAKGGSNSTSTSTTSSTAKKLGANNSSNALKMTEDMILDSEAAVMANFEFLGNADVEMSDEDEANDNDIMEHDQHQPQDQLNATTVEQQDLAKRKQQHNKIIIPDDDVDAEAEEVLNELNMLTGGVGANATGSAGGEGVGDTGSNLVLGELAQLTVNNEAENNYDAGTGNTKDGNFRKLWCAKFTLRSHFDSVRALAFHPQDPVLITASDDHTLKFWNIHKTVQAKKSPSLDVEPLYTFRAHSGPVLCVAMSGTGEFCYSGGVDGAIHSWKLPNSYIDPYDSYDPTVLHSTLEAHTDAVWGLTVNHAKSYLASFSADDTVRLWAPQAKAPMLRAFQAVAADGTTPIVGPTSVDFVRDELDRVVVAYRGAQLVTFDTETGKQVLRFDTSKQQEQAAAADRFIYKAVSHPTMPVTITAHHDRHIRFWDTNTGQLVHSMVAHLDAVTSLAVDPKGLYLLSGSHDNSIRLWNLDNRTCIQEITAHRKKFDESILDVAFHPSRGYIASGGADSLAKVFV